MVHLVSALSLLLVSSCVHIYGVSSFSIPNQAEMYPNLLDKEFTEDSRSKLRDESTHLVFPGGGIFFYWQAGAVTYLREAGYDLSKVSISGASAGALTATLTAADVDFYDATRLALKLAGEEDVWDRRGGLQGIWGPMIERWLDELLPPDASDKVEGRVS